MIELFEFIYASVMNRRHRPLAKSKQILFQKKLGRFIAKKRIDTGLSQEELALSCDTTQSHIARIERGALAPGFIILLKIAHSLNCKISDFAPFP